LYGIYETLNLHHMNNLCMCQNCRK